MSESGCGCCDEDCSGSQSNGISGSFLSAEQYKQILGTKHTGFKHEAHVSISMPPRLRSKITPLRQVGHRKESIPAISSNQSSELMEPNTGNMTNFHSSGSILQIKSTNKRTFNKSKGAPQKLPEMPLTYENIRETEYGAKNLTINPCGILDLIRKNMEGLHFNIPPENKESMQNDDLSEWSD